MTEDIIFTKEGQLGVMTLNRVSALNALTLPMILSLYQQLQLWQDDPAIQAVVIKAVPGIAFCAGGDVRSLYDNRNNPSQQMLFFRQEYCLNQLIYHYKKPYIALMDGITMGGGVGISLHGSHTVASENFVFSMPETGIGFFPDIGAGYLLSRCPNHVGMYLGLTGHRIREAEAKALGLIKYVMPSERFQMVLSQLRDKDLTMNPYAQVDECLQSLASPELHAPITEIAPLIDKCFDGDDIIAIMQNLTVLKDAWHSTTLAILKKKSPLSLKITCEQLNRAKKMSLDECLAMDYCIAEHFMKGDDFYEGVRALLIDKDKSPQWKPQDITAITPDNLRDYFVSYFGRYPYKP
jgi:enoyl-CoA hydratase